MIESDYKSKSKFIQSASLAMHDPLCMAVCLFPEVVTKSLELNVKVETTENSLTKGMTIVDGRRWKVKQPLKEEIEEFKSKIAEESPAIVTVVFQADTNLFFKKFLGTVFGLEWNETTKQWSSQ
jgi:inosine-uridine nucleoside N-ribohydrolase